VLIFIILPTPEGIAYKAYFCIFYLVAVNRCTENLLDSETDEMSKLTLQPQNLKSPTSAGAKRRFENMW